MILIEKNSKVTATFITWLVDELKKQIMTRVDINKLKKLTMHSSEVFDKEINMVNAFFAIVHNIRFYELPGSYVIEIPNNVFFQGNSIHNLYNYINYGTLQVQGHPIIHNILSSVNLNLNKYLSKYNLVGVL